MALKENIRVEGKREIQTKVMTTLFAEVEPDPISERTREGLAKAKALGAGKIERPRASLNVSRLDGKEDRRFLDLGVSKAAIDKITSVNPIDFIGMRSRDRVESATAVAEDATSPRTGTQPITARWISSPARLSASARACTSSRALCHPPRRPTVLSCASPA